MAAATRSTTRASGTDLTHAGAGLALGIVQASAIIPGLLPVLILTGVVVAVVVVPLIVLGLLTALLAAPPYALWRVAARRRARASEAPTA